MSDGFAGIVKGVILSMAPDVSIVDITHDIEPFDIKSGAWIIQNARKYFPADAIHIVVVDPGVGSHRRCIALSTEHGIFLAPDNGVLSMIASTSDRTMIVHLNKPQYWLNDISNTFHGRDIFAPAAAHIALGVKQEDMGDELDDIVLLEGKLPELEEQLGQGEILHVDGFGNLISNIPSDWSHILGLPFNWSRIASADCYLDGRFVGKAVHSYADVGKGEVAVVPGSHGFIEIAVNQGNAAAVLHARVGSSVRLQIHE